MYVPAYIHVYMYTCMGQLIVNPVCIYVTSHIRILPVSWVTHLYDAIREVS